MNTLQTPTDRLSQEQLSERFNVELGKLLAETGRLNAEISKISAETSKISAETSKINAESRWYPIAMAAALMTAGGGLVGVLIKFVF